VPVHEGDCDTAAFCICTTPLSQHHGAQDACHRRLLTLSFRTTLLALLTAAFAACCREVLEALPPDMVLGADGLPIG
jgi:hypothetical protein